jgi:hypothetical protein
MKTTGILFLALAFVISAWSYTTPTNGSAAPEIKNLKFGHITIDGIEYEKDVVIENGKVRQRKKGPSKPYRSEYGHTPLTVHENIPWDCDTLVVGIGMSSRLPVTKAFKKEAKSKGVTLILLQTPKAVKYFIKHYGVRTNAIFHITC